MKPRLFNCIIGVTNIHTNCDPKVGVDKIAEKLKVN